MQRVYQRRGNWSGCSAFQYSDTTRQEELKMDGFKHPPSVADVGKAVTGQRIPVFGHYAIREKGSSGIVSSGVKSAMASAFGYLPLRAVNGLSTRRISHFFNFQQL